MNFGSLGSLFIDMAVNTAKFETDMGRAARVSAQRSKEIQRGIQDATQNIVAAIAAADIGRRFGEGIKRAIDDADALSKASQKVGVSIQQLSALKIAGAFADVDFGQLQTGLAKFNQSIHMAAVGGREQQDAFKALGISIKDVNGNLKPTNDLFLKVADVFARSEDSSAKTAIAMALLGRAGADMIPLFNGGSESIKEFTELASRLGLIIDKETGKAAEDFNDRLTLIGLTTQGLYTKVAAGLLPTLNDLAQQYINWATNSDNVERATRNIDTGLRSVIVTVLAAKSAFSALGTTIGGVLAASEIFTKDVSFSSFFGGKIFFDLRKNVGAARDALKEAFSDARDNMADDIDGMAKAWKSGADKLKKSELEMSRAAGAGGKNKLIFGSDPADAAAAKAAAAAAKKEADALAAFHQRIDDIVRKASESGNVALDHYNDRLREIHEAQARAIKSGVDLAQTQDDVARATAAASEQFQQETRDFRALFDADSQRLFTDNIADQFQRQIAQASAVYQAEITKLEKLRDNASITPEEFNQRASGLTTQRDNAVLDATLGGSFGARALGVDSLDKLREALNPVNTAMLQLGDTMHDAFTRANDSLAELITNTVLFGDKGEISGKKIAAAFVQDVVGGLVRVGLQMAENFAISQIFGASSLASTVAYASTASAAWAPAAIGASIATFGAADAAGLAAYLGSLAAGSAATAATGAIAGFADGGLVRGGRQLIQINERGQEFVMNAAATARYRGTLEAMNSGAAASPGVAAAGGSRIVNNAPGLIIRQADGLLTIDMVPDLLDVATGRAQVASVADAQTNGPVTRTSNARNGSRRLPAVAGRR